MTKKLFATGVGAAITAGAFAFAVPSASAEIVLLACNATSQSAKLNPPLKSGDAKYFKATGTATPGGSCIVNTGIATDQSTQDVKYTLDNQTNGHTSLTTASSKTTTMGSFTCNGTDPALLRDYPASYPSNGKLTTRFNELDAALRQIQIQAYIRLGRDPLDPVANNSVVTGIVIKGPGVGGNVHAVVNLQPDLGSSKNLNLLDCIASPASGTALLYDLLTVPADGSDADTTVDLWTISIPS